MTSSLFRSFSILLFLPAAAWAQQGAPLPGNGGAAGLRLGFVEGRAVQLRFEGDPARTFWVESSPDLTTWQPLPLPANAVGGTTLEIFDPAGLGHRQRFYRVPPAVPDATPVPERYYKRLPNLAEGSGADGDSFSVSWQEAILAPVNDSGFGTGFDPSQRMNAAQLAAARTEGMAAWRRIGAHGSCTSCHSPDGFDLALIGYSDADITRRALDHVTAGEAAQIVTWIKALRQTHGIARPLHPRQFRPLQPGHLPLPGATHSARDLAFGNLLNSEAALLWAKDRITSRAQALAAQAQLLALDLRKLPVGIPFDLWSEDAAHGSDHLSVSEWLPNMGMQPAPGKAAEWYALHDAYLADPTDANFWAYYSRMEELLVPVEPAGYERGQTWNLLKYQSVHVAAHMLRHQSLCYPDALSGHGGGMVANRSTVIARNPLFRTGDAIRRNPLHFDAANPSTTFPPFLAATVPASQTVLREQNDNFLRVWFWMGWAYDPALLLSDSIFQTVEGDYLYSSLLQHYKVHHAFVVAMTSVAKANSTAWFNASGPGVRGHGKWAAFNPFMVLHHIERNRNEPPAGDARRVLHDRMYSNTARLWIYLVHEDLERTGSVYDRNLVRGVIRFCRAWLNDTEAGMDHTALDAVIADIETRLNAAQELRTDFTGDDLPGGLPF